MDFISGSTIFQGFSVGFFSQTFWQSVGGHSMLCYGYNRLTISSHTHSLFLDCWVFLGSHIFCKKSIHKIYKVVAGSYRFHLSSKRVHLDVDLGYSLALCFNCLIIKHYDAFMFWQFWYRCAISGGSFCCFLISFSHLFRRCFIHKIARWTYGFCHLVHLAILCSFTSCFLGHGEDLIVSPSFCNIFFIYVITHCP